tara:strand:+ start:1024 stop:1206 length:183 start_codon:yes stop_codon:yes gene_type:complete
MISYLIIILSLSSRQKKRIKEYVEMQRLWADGELDQMEVYNYTHNILLKYNITDEKFVLS